MIFKTPWQGDPRVNVINLTVFDRWRSTIGLMFREPWKPGMASTELPRPAGKNARMDSCVSRNIRPLGRILVNSYIIFRVVSAGIS
jgi:hypothetical protein